MGRRIKGAPYYQMKKNCIRCEEPNPQGWFICRACGQRSSEPKFTTNMYMMSEIGKRTDVEFSTTTMDKTIERAKGERLKQGSQFWQSKLKEFNKRRNHA